MHGDAGPEELIWSARKLLDSVNCKLTVMSSMIPHLPLRQWCRNNRPRGRLLSASVPEYLALLLIVGAMSILPATIQAEIKPGLRALDLSLEELMDVQVTTASRKPEALSESDAAVYVITGEDIRRSGVTTIAEALRLAPGVQVARISPHEWAISSRGFAGQFANKLLVLVDGRTVYTPLFSGVNWDTVDTLLHDVERIEVVRGPGGALWGANAVNGVINVITKSAKETPGFYAEGGGGTFERAFAGMRYGGAVGNLSYRLYGKYFDRGDFPTVFDTSDENDWTMGQGGFRADWTPTDEDSFTFQGDFYGGDKQKVVSRSYYVPPFAEIISDEVSLRGGNLLSRWTHRYGEDAETRFQTYYDRFDREQQLFAEDVQTLDFDLQHQFCWGDRQELMAGLGYRSIWTDLKNGPNVQFLPEDRHVHLPSAFVQDQIALSPERLFLTLGTKLEHHYFSGWNVQPNGRLLWKVDDKNTVWSAVSRAVRTPSFGEAGIRTDFAVDPGPPLTVYAATASGTLKPEEVTAYELGYRVDPIDRLAIDIATFYNVYDRFQTFEPGTPFVENTPGPPHLVVPFSADNKAYGETYGVELATRLKAIDWCRIDASYTYLQIQLHNRNSLEPSAEFAERESPHHQFTVRTAFDLSDNVQLDWVVRYVDSLPGFSVPSYLTTDIRLAWRVSDNLEFALVGQNLLDDRHPEFRNPGGLVNVQSGSEVPRAVYAKMSWGF